MDKRTTDSIEKDRGEHGDTWQQKKHSGNNREISFQFSEKIRAEFSGGQQYFGQDHRVGADHKGGLCAGDRARHRYDDTAAGGRGGDSGGRRDRQESAPCACGYALGI